MNRFFNSIKFKMLERKIAKIFEVDKSQFGPLESLAETILTCPKLFIKKDSLLNINKYVTFDLMLVSFSYARYLVGQKFIDAPIAEGELLGYVYAGSNGMYGLTQYDILNSGNFRISVFEKIFNESKNLTDALDKVLEEAVILIAHDFDSCGPKYYGEDSPLTVLPIHIQTQLELETISYLSPMFKALERVISNY